MPRRLLHDLIPESEVVVADDWYARSTESSSRCKWEASHRYRMEAAHWLTERGFGKPPQTVELTAEDGRPVVVKLIWPESE
jgi:hypothetical protein